MENYVHSLCEILGSNCGCKYFENIKSPLSTIAGVLTMAVVAGEPYGLILAIHAGLVCTAREKFFYRFYPRVISVTLSMPFSDVDRA